MLLAAAVALVGVPYLYSRVDEEIRKRAEALIAGKYPQLAVHVRSAKLVSGQGIEIRGVSIHEPAANGPQSELLYLEELFVFCQTDLQELVKGMPPIRQFTIRRPTLRLTRRTDGTWSASKLLPIPKFSEEPPQVTIEGGVVEIFDPLKNPSTTLTLRDANLRIEPAPPVEGWPAGRTPLRLQGRAAGDHFHELTIDATFDPRGTAWQMHGAVEGVELSPDLCHSLPVDHPDKVVEFENVRGRAMARFRVAYRADAKPPLDYEVAGEVTRGRIDDARLPYPLTELRGTFHFDPRNVVLKELTARCGQAELRLDAERAGFDAASPLRVSLVVSHLALDVKLRNMLPVAWHDEWMKYLPTGEVDLRAALTYDGHTWQPEVVAHCTNVGFTYHKFPYRLERGRGTIELRQDKLQFQLVANADSAPVRLSGTVVLTKPVQVLIEVAAENLRIDDKFFSALPDKPAEIVRSLNPYGTLNVSYRFATGDPAKPGPKHQATLTLNRCAMKYAKFPYLLDNVRGTIEMRDEVWLFRDLEGINGAARITCNGQLVITRAGSDLALRFTGTNVPLDEELREALNPGAQQLFNDLKPRGAVDLDVEYGLSPSEPQGHLHVAARPLETSVSVEPTMFPFRLEGVQGAIKIVDGRVTLDAMRARHGVTEVALRGFCDIQSGGGWALHFDELIVDRLRPDRELVQALPVRLKKVVGDLHLSGPMNLRGQLDLASRGGGQPLVARWNAQVEFHQCSIAAGIAMEHIDGGMTLIGGFDGTSLQCRGELNIDSLTVKNLQFTELLGPFWIDDSQLLLGHWADRVRQIRPERRLTCKIFGGTVLGDGWVALQSKPRYGLTATLAGADMARLTQEAIPGRQPLTGQLLAEVELHGQGQSINDLGGRGSIQLRNADIYQLPLMVSLLKLLAVRQPDATAFTKSDVDFYIQGEHIYVERADFSGDAISLLGKGEVGLDRQIHLTFHAMVGRNENRLPMVKNVLGGASQQILLIHAEGSLEEPVLRREAFPGVSQALQQLQAEFQNPNAPRRLGSPNPVSLPPVYSAGRQ